MKNQIFDCARGMDPGLAQGERVAPLPPRQSPHCLVTRQAAWNKFKLIVLLVPTAIFLIGCGVRGVRQHEGERWAMGAEASAVSPDPSNIVLMLPLKGKFAADSKAIRNGFLAAYYHARKKNPDVNIKVLDTTGNDPRILYKEAIASGAGIVVGPLTKRAVEDLMKVDSLPVPVIALNTLDDYSSYFRANFYQFGLLPQDEATQVADKMMLDKHDQAAVIFPDNAWGEKIADTFKDRYEQSGGQVAAFLSYNSKANISEQICYFLAEDPNELCVPKKKKDKKKEKKKEKEQKKLAGEGQEPEEEDLEPEEPKRRQDINTIFLVANAKDARQIVPMLKFYYAGDLPVYATSSIYSGVRAPNLDRDLDGMNFCDMPWVLQNPRFFSADLQSIHQQVTTLWHDSFSSHSKLYGLGVDAYILATGLNKFLRRAHDGLDGATGKLYLDNSNHIYRELKWARMRRGVPVVHK